jgi:hypothetical protein
MRNYRKEMREQGEVIMKNGVRVKISGRGEFGDERGRLDDS